MGLLFFKVTHFFGVYVVLMHVSIERCGELQNRGGVLFSGGCPQAVGHWRVKILSRVCCFISFVERCCGIVVVFSLTSSCSICS